MSTCQGAPAPHECEHGDACDWTPPAPELEELEEVAALERRRPRGLHIGPRRPEGVTVTIEPAPVGRVTGWRVTCSDEDHGTMPVLAPGKTAATIAAGRHVQAEHRGNGRVLERGRRRSA